jgi:HPt (histidine-containing phosphotransfer) domain-containing protein
VRSSACAATGTSSGGCAAQFAEGVPSIRTKLRGSVEQKDAQALAFATHRLRGQAASFDGEAVVAAVKVLEDAGRREGWTAARAALLAVEHELDRLLQALAQVDTDG